MIIQERNQLNNSFIIKILKSLIFAKNIIIVKFKINDCFENFTHEPIVFVDYFCLLFHSFFQRNNYTKICHYGFFKHLFEFCLV